MVGTGMFTIVIVGEEKSGRQPTASELRKCGFIVSQAVKNSGRGGSSAVKRRKEAAETRPGGPRSHLDQRTVSDPFRASSTAMSSCTILFKTVTS